jgi:uncharacterized protein YkwD
VVSSVLVNDKRVPNPNLNFNLTFILIISLNTLLLVACGGGRTPKDSLTPLPSTTASVAAQIAVLPADAPPRKANNLLSVIPSPTTEPEPSPTPYAAELNAPTTPSPPEPVILQYVVQAGDTLWNLALFHGVSMAAIQLANGMGNSIDLIAGQTLAIPNSPQWLGENTFWMVHVVRQGETLVGIASTYSMTVDDILRVNAIADPALIHVDQQLVMPLTQLTMTNAPQPTEAPVAVAAAANPQSALPPAESTAPAAPAPPASEPSQPPAPAAPPPQPPSSAADWPVFILTRINQVRAEHGLNALALAPELTYAAQAHAQDCAQRGWGSHVGSDGAVLKVRLERAGYLGENWGENWVQALNAGRAFDWWYGEIPPNDPHRRNILSPNYTEAGIGIAETGWGYIFVTDFGRR